MKTVPTIDVEECRIRGPRGSNNGAFVFERRNAVIRVIASDGMGWDHVSVSLATRCPTWDEMCWVKDKFFGPEEAVMQLHPPKSEHVNHHEFCLHMWRPQSPEEMERIKLAWGNEWEDDWKSPGEIPMPPSFMVGPDSAKGKK